MNQKQRAKWERIRAKGMWRFVLLYWVLGWGGFMIIIASGYSYFFRHRGFSVDDLIITIPTYLVGGFIIGLVLWLIGEYQYQKDSRSAPLR